jgi:hypothetical protein
MFAWKIIMVIMHVMMKDVNHARVVWVVLVHHVIFILVNVNVNRVLAEGRKDSLICFSILIFGFNI